MEKARRTNVPHRPSLAVVGVIAVVFLLTTSLLMFYPDNELPADELPTKIYVDPIYTFSVASDGHIGELILANSNPNGERNQILANSVIANGAQRHFETGDILDEATKYPLYPTVKSIYDEMGIPYHLVAGNHDNPGYFLQAFGYDSLHYNVTDGDYVWLMMDSKEHYLPAAPQEMNATQLQYIEDALNYYSTKLVFIMFHINHIKLSYPGLEVDSPTFRAIVEPHADHIGGIFCGHSHNWKAITYEVNSIRYTNAGTYGNSYAMGGVSYYPYRYLMVDVYEDWTIDIKRINPDTDEECYGSTTSYIPDIGASPVWNASGSEPRLASVAGNWLNGVPTVGKTAIFNDTSILNATWDIDVACSLYLMDGWNGTVNQTVNTTFQDFILWDGWYNPNPDNRTIISGNGLAQGSQNTLITNNVFRVEFSGDYKLYSFPYLTPILKELIISGNVQQTGRQYVGTSGIGMNVTGTLYINPGIRFTLYPYAESIFSGNVTGPGEFAFDAYSYSPSGFLPEITGTFDIDNVVIQSENSRTIKMAYPYVFNGSVFLEKTVAGGENYLYTCNHSLTVGGLNVGTDFTLHANDTTTIICNGTWDSSNGTFVEHNSTVNLTATGSYARLASGDSFNILTITNDRIRIMVDTPVTIGFASDPSTLYIQPTLGFVNITVAYPVDSQQFITDETVLAWSIIAAESNETITVQITGLDSGYSFKVFRNGIYSATGDGPTLTFSIEAEGEFIVSLWYRTQVSMLIIFAINIIGIGIFLAVIAGFVMPYVRAIKKGQQRPTQVIIKDALKAVIFIVVALAMWGMLYKFAIG